MDFDRFKTAIVLTPVIKLPIFNDPVSLFINEIRSELTYQKGLVLKSAKKFSASVCIIVY
jgi:hypothetical protein